MSGVGEEVKRLRRAKGWDAGTAGRVRGFFAAYGKPT